MATNSELNILSREFFDYAKSKTRILSSDNVTENDEKSVNALLQATLTVRNFYSENFENIIKNHKTEYQKSKEFCNFVRRMCDSEKWFRKLTIFERYFVIISFVFTCLEYLRKQNIDVKSLFKETRVVWEEYFIEYIEEFHKEGGWADLIRVAHSYATIDNLMSIFPLGFTEFLKSVANYMFFCLLREDIPEEKTKSKIFKNLEIGYDNKHKTCASLWIKFILQNSSAEIFDAIFTKPPQDPLEVTVLLRVLRDLCDPNFYEEKEQEFSNSIIKNVPLQNTTLQKGYEDKNNDIENFTMREDVGTKNSPFITSVIGEVLSKSSTTVENECENVNCNIKTFTRYEDDGVKNAPLFSSVAGGVLGKSNIAAKKELKNKDSNIKTFTQGKDNGVKNAPLFSSVAGGVLGKSNPAVNKECKNKDSNIKTFTRGTDDGIKNANLIPTVAGGVVGESNTVVEKECENKDSNIKTLAGGETVGVKNAPLVSPAPGKSWSKSNVWMTVHKKGRVKVSDEICNFDEAMSACSISNNLLQNAAIKKERNDCDNENFTGCESNGIHNANNTLSIAGENASYKQKKKRNRKRKNDKSSKSVDPIEQEPSNNICNVSLKNIEVQRVNDNNGNFEKDENGWMYNVQYVSSMDNEMLDRSNKGEINGRKAGLQVCDKNVKRSEATGGFFSITNAGVSSQSVAIEKENADKGTKENNTGVDNGKASRASGDCSLS